MTNTMSTEIERLRNIIAGLPEDIGRRIMERGADIAEGAKMGLDTMQQSQKQQDTQPS